MSVRVQVVRYLLNSSQEFRDLSRGKQVMRIREHYGWCESSIPTVLRALSYWQSAVRVAPASPDVERRRLRKSARKRDKKFNTLCRRRGESLHHFQDRVLAGLPEDLRHGAHAQLGGGT